MDNPRPEKVVVVDEVRTRLDVAAASVLTEYRGLTVKDLAALRRSLAAAGGDYKIFKNTLVKRAIDGSAYAHLDEFLTGPTAITFVHGDVSAVAKALRDFARTNSHLVVKGGLVDGSILSPAQLGALADLPPRDQLLAQFAGALQAPLSQLAGLMQALTRNLAYGLKALLDERGGAPTGGAGVAEPTAPAPPAPAESAVEPAPDESVAGSGDAGADAVTSRDPEAESPPADAASAEDAAPGESGESAGEEEGD
jgi:large subunit ribosomal protein L10